LSGTSADFLLESPLLAAALNFSSGKLFWIRTQLLSELRFHLGRQAEVLAARVERTNLVIQRAIVRLLPSGSPPDVPNFIWVGMFEPLAIRSATLFSANLVWKSWSCGAGRRNSVYHEGHSSASLRAGSGTRRQAYGHGLCDNSRGR
jgi:hypothetical protein